MQNPKLTVDLLMSNIRIKWAAILSACFTVLFLSACGSGTTSNGSAEIPAGGSTSANGSLNGTTNESLSPNNANSSGTDGGGSTAGGSADAGTSDGGNTDGGEQQITDPGTPEINNEQTSFFFSYDESASTASRDLALTALANGRKPNPGLGRPYEFLNAEKIGASVSEPVGPFDVSMGLLRSENGDIPLESTPEGSVYGLGVHISGPTQTLEDRRNVVLTVLLDISGSMGGAYASETAGDVNSLLDVAKLGLINMQQSLKQGDVVNLVTFATNADIVLEAHSPSQDSLTDIVNRIFTTTSTDINNGLELAYQVANRTYDVDKANRVVIITDANVNTGVIDPAVIAEQTVINGLEGIYFSGVGVGSSFNDRVLNTITDAGKGSYSAMITPADATRLFTNGFSRFMNPAVRDVRFQLTYPQEMDQLKSFAEEISTVASDVQTINFSYNSDQFFLELFSGPSVLTIDQELQLDITFKDESGQPQSVSVSQRVDAVLGQKADEIKAATAVATLAQLINGSLSCDTVQSSQLYNIPVQHEVYVSYKKHIDRFCGL